MDVRKQDNDAALDDCAPQFPPTRPGRLDRINLCHVLVNVNPRWLQFSRSRHLRQPLLYVHRFHNTYQRRLKECSHCKFMKRQHSPNLSKAYKVASLEYAKLNIANPPNWNEIIWSDE
ncbi:hypothetical protein H257_15433 [Aphanomyces astaci]|uniref:Uncharacterized protein n=1 Tax=Aphanomyces astaci TaxID=112090 RepID=W4FPN7_APHAT|nr:hypothetical protein H257_15433 [Aphanomyces astaci]ETV68623.1 hypothetical protein H257_15433 [Aphanomyces astaci]|eukprot:XP_009841848.1 hypothetical protein H257_15433 [Aphanomyces astaci]